MKILIVANHYAVCSARYAAEALVRLGHEVRHVGPARGRDIWGLKLPPASVWEPEDSMAVDYDLTVVMDSDPTILDMIQEPGTVVVWGVDNHVKDYRRPYFDHYFLAHRHSSAMAWPEGSKVSEQVLSDDQIAAHYKAHLTPITGVVLTPTAGDMTWLPCAYDPARFTPSPIPYEEREYDVCCLGVMYPQRREAVQTLREAGLKVIAGCGLVYDAYRDVHHNSRLALCMSAKDDLAIRVFEAAAMGCLPLSDQVADLLHEDTNAWLRDTGFSGFPTFSHDGDMLLHATTLTQGEEVEAAKAAITKLQAEIGNHTWDKRAEKVIEWYQGLGEGV